MAYSLRSGTSGEDPGCVSVCVCVCVGGGGGQIFTQYDEIVLRLITSIPPQFSVIVHHIP